MANIRDILKVLSNIAADDMKVQQKKEALFQELKCDNLTLAELEMIAADTIQQKRRYTAAIQTITSFQSHLQTFYDRKFHQEPVKPFQVKRIAPAHYKPNSPPSSPQ